MVNLHKVPERIAYLTMLHIHKQIRPFEIEELDAWILESDDNLELFEEMVDIDV